MKIYLDILLITNAAVCLILLEASAAVTHTALRPLRSFCAAVIGSSASLFIAVECSSYFAAALVCTAKLAVMALCVFTAFGRSSRLLQNLIIYIAAKTLFTGICFVFWQLSDSRTLIVQSFTVYFNVSVLRLILAAGAVYVLLEAAEKVRSLRGRLDGFRAVYQRGSLIVCMPAVCDSGNRLTDSFTGQPIVVLCSDKLYYKFGLDSDLPEGLTGFRLTPYRSVGGSGLLHITSSGTVRLIDPSGRSRPLRCTVGIARSYGNAQRALFSPVLLD